MSKHQLIKTWPAPELVCNVAKFVGFIRFYAHFIPHFEVRIAPLRVIILNEYTDSVNPYWSNAAKAAFDEMRQAILYDPCLRCFDHRNLRVLRTDFSADGFGYVACQPANDDISLAAMTTQMKGGHFDFMTKESQAMLHPVAFGCRRSRGNKTRLHSHLGEGFTGDWSINKCHHKCFGQRFTWVTDCYGIKFILSYDGCNSAVLWLQMRFMCWDMDIEHRNDHWLTDANYLSCLGADLSFDPLLKDYIQRTDFLRRRNPLVASLPMEPKNMPYFLGPRLPHILSMKPDASSPPTATSPIKDSDNNAILASDHALLAFVKTGSQHFANWPVSFGSVQYPCLPRHWDKRCLYNSDLTLTAKSIAHFDWAVYGFNSGHFISSIQSLGLPFNITLAATPFVHGCSLFTEFSATPSPILSGASALLHHMHSSGITSIISGYLIHSHRYLSTKPTSRFGEIQALIVTQLRLTRSLSIVMALMHPEHDSHAVTQNLVNQLRKDGWIITDTSITYSDFGNSVSGGAA